MGNLGPREVIVLLNSLPRNELSRIESELARARDALHGMGQADLGDRVEDARQSLRAGRLTDFRRTVATVTSRLGHVK
jgi:hypothetical protein